MPVNHVVLAKIAAVAEKKLRPEFHIGWPEAQEKTGAFKVNADGKVRHSSGMKVSKWMETLREVTPNLFVDGTASAPGNKKAVNPWSKEGWNISAQGSLLKSGIPIERVAAIAAAAGSRIGATKPGPTKRLSQAYERSATGKPERVA
jgi:hypothetical protein